MEYRVFESRILELLYKTDVKLTPQAAAFRLGIPVDEARAFLETMTTTGVLTMDVDDDGVILFDVPGRPAPSNEPLSWMVPAAPHPPGYGVYGVPGYGPPPYGYPPPQALYVPIRPGYPVPYYPPGAFVGAEKSVVGAVLLAMFFGPLGMLYSTVRGGLLMLLISFFVLPLTMGLGIFLLYPAWMLWAGFAASQHNDRLRAGPPRPLLLP